MRFIKEFFAIIENTNIKNDRYQSKFKKSCKTCRHMEDRTNYRSIYVDKDYSCYLNDPDFKISEVNEYICPFYRPNDGYAKYLKRLKKGCCK